MDKKEILTALSFLEKHIPADSNHIGVRELYPDFNCENSFILGKVVRKWEKQCRKTYKRTMLKIFIKSIDPNKKQDEINLTIFLFDKLAEEGDLIEIGDYIALTEFEIQEAPWKREDDAYSLCVILRKISSKIVIARNTEKEPLNDPSHESMIIDILINEDELQKSENINSSIESIIDSTPNSIKTRSALAKATQGGVAMISPERIGLKNKPKQKHSAKKAALDILLESTSGENALPSCPSKNLDTSINNSLQSNSPTKNTKRKTPVKGNKATPIEKALPNCSSKNMGEIISSNHNGQNNSPDKNYIQKTPVKGKEPKPLQIGSNERILRSSSSQNIRENMILDSNLQTISPNKPDKRKTLNKPSTSPQSTSIVNVLPSCSNKNMVENISSDVNLLNNSPDKNKAQKTPTKDKKSTYSLRSSFVENAAPNCSNKNLEENGRPDKNGQNISPQNTGKQKSPVKGKKPYSYSTIQEILGRSVEEDQRYNLYAVVLKCEIKNSLTNSHLNKLELTLADSSSNHLECQILGKKDEPFPEINYKDIIRIHRLKIEKYRYTVYVKCFSPKDIVVFNKDNLKPSSTALIRTIDEEETKIVEEIKEWFLRKYSRFKKFNQMELGCYADVYCQVVANALLTEDQMQVLSVWDGTIPENYNNIYFCHYKSIDQDSNMLAIVKDFLIHVWVYDIHAVEAKNIKPGEYVLIRNLHYHKARNSTHSKFYLHTGSNHNRGFDILCSDNIFHKKFISAINEEFEKLSMANQAEEKIEVSTEQVPETIPSQVVQDNNSFLFSSMIESFVDPLSNINLLKEIPENFRLISKIVGTKIDKLLNLTDLLKIQVPSKNCVRSLAKLKISSDSRPIDYLSYLCPNCGFVELYQKDSSREQHSNPRQMRSCANKSCKKRRIRGKLRKHNIHLNIYFTLTLMDEADNEIDLLVHGENASSLLKGLTPLEALSNLDKFNEYLEVFTAEGIVMDCCVLIDQNQESPNRKTLVYSITNTVLDVA